MVQIPQSILIFNVYVEFHFWIFIFVNYSLRQLIRGPIVLSRNINERLRIFFESFENKKKKIKVWSNFPSAANFSSFCKQV